MLIEVLMQNFNSIGARSKSAFKIGITHTFILEYFFIIIVDIGPRLPP